MGSLCLICFSCFLGATPLFAVAGGKSEAAKTVEKKVAVGSIVMLANMPATVTAGSAANVNIVLENNGKDDVRYLTRSKYLDYDLALLDAKGKPVPLTLFGKTAYGDYRTMGGSARIPTLPAGKRMEVRLNIARVFDLSEEGEYTLSIRRELRPLKGAIDIKVEKMTFKVLEGPR